ncbi:MAG: REP-associated tyrosine transposase [Chitinophagales bacterium]
MEFTRHHAQFFTATILEWKHLLKPSKYKDIIMESFRFLTNDQRLQINAFVIMNNHIHTIWQIMGRHKREDVQRDFLKYTAQHIKSDLRIRHPSFLEAFKVNAKDREYQIWERNSLSVDLYSAHVFFQKFEYIHFNPVKAGICELPEDYKYSSARFYLTGKDDFGFIRHYDE